MKITMVKKNTETKERQNKELEGNEDTLVSMLQHVIESDSYREVQGKLGEIMLFEIDNDSSQEEAESLYGKLLEKIVKSDKIDNYVDAWFLQNGKEVLTFEKDERYGYFSTNYYERISGKTEFCDLSLFEPKSFKSLPIPDHKDPKKSREAMRKYNPIGISL
ncbi:MAG: hypothetical protein OIF36_05080 [Alphaproteobacteria bacterium]|nr:hypothetical protein [Alphaproteobacteria bacterium]